MQRETKYTITLEELLRERNEDEICLENHTHIHTHTKKTLIKSFSLLPRNCLLEGAGNGCVIFIQSLQSVVFNPKGDEMILM